MIPTANKQRTKTSASVAQTLRAQAEARKANPGAIWGLPWAWEGLNKLTGGIHPSEMTVLAARPGVGKTSILVQQTNRLADYLESAEGIAKHDGKVIKLALLESSAEVFQRRWAIQRSGVSKRRLMQGTLSDVAYNRYLDSLDNIEQMPIEYADGEAILSLDDLVNFLLRGSKAVWWGLDYLQKVPHGDGGYGAITQISNKLMTVARDYAPGMVLSQLTRAVDQREDKRPQLQDLRGSGQIEADARVVLGLYRERMYVRVPEEQRNDPHEAELIVLKNNEGDTGGYLQTIFHPKNGIFEDVSGLFADTEDD